MMDPSKLDKMKVVELRAELQARGLDTKGVKAILVERLKSALETEIATVTGADPEPSTLQTEIPIQSAPSPIIQTTPGRRSRRAHSSTRSPSPPESRRIEQIISTETEITAPGSSEGLEILPEEPIVHDYSRENLTAAAQLHVTEAAAERAKSAEKLKTQDKSKLKNPEKVVVKLKIEKYHDTYVAGKVEETPLSSYIEHQQQLRQQQLHQQQQAMRTPEKTMRVSDEVKVIKTPAEKKIMQPMEIFPSQEQQRQRQQEKLHEQKQQQPQKIHKSPEQEVEDATMEQVVVEKISPEKQQKIDITDKMKTPERKRFSDSLEETPARKSPPKSEIISTFQELKNETIEQVNKQKEEKTELEMSIENDKMDVDNEKDEIPEEKRDHSVERNESTEDKPKEQVEERPSRKRPRSKSRSSSKSRSKSRSRSRSRSKSSRSRSRSKSKSRSRSRSPRRVQRRSPAPNIDDFTNEEDEPVVEDKQFGLSWFDSDLHLRIDPVAFNSAKPLHEEAFGLVWSGARTNYGVREGKVVYEVRLSEEVPAEDFRSEDHLFGFRAGFSLLNGSLLLGEVENSFAYCSNGKKAVNGEFIEYSKPFKLDDVVGCYLDLDSSPCKINFTLNGEDLGTAFEFDKEILGENAALFPHVLTKGYEFQVNFADNENLLGNAERPARRRKRERRSRSRSKSRSVRSKSRSHSVEKRNSKEKKVEQQLQKADDGENWDDDANMTEKKSQEEKADLNKSENLDNQKNEDEPSDEKSEKMETDKDEVKSENETKVENKDDTSSSVEKKKDEKGESDEWEIIEPEARPVVELLPGYQLIALIPEDQYIPGPQRPESRKECEVVLMVGLPGAGKTYWVQNYVKENADKRFEIIGADALIDKMKIDGKPRKEYHSGKWEKVYDLCLKSVTTLEDIATKRRRNYILDQTNVFASDQRRKMKGFGDFKRIAVVCIPNEEEMKRRNDMIKESQGYKETLKESTLNRMKANFNLPSVEFGWFDEVRFTDLDGDEAKDEVKKYNEKGNKALEASEPSRYKRPRRENYRRNDDRRRRDDRRRYDDRGSRWKNNDRRGSNNRWGPPGGGGGNRGGQWRDDRGYGGYDRRNDRYSSSSGGWASYSSRRYDDRFYRPQGGSGGGGGGGGGSRYDYGSRDYGRDHRYDRDRNGSSSGSSNRRESSSSSHHRGGSQRDFRSGHRDNRSEDSRGGYERSSSSSKHSSTENYYNDHKNGRSGSSSSKSTNNASSNHQKSQWGGGSQHSTSQQQQQHSQMQSVSQQGWNTSTAGQQQASYWGYDPQNSYGAYGNQQQQQQQWPMNSADPRQQQQWMNWWQQQGGNNQQHQQQYWAQYAYPQQQQQTQVVGGDSNSGGHSEGTRSDSKK